MTFDLTMIFGTPSTFSLVGTNDKHSLLQLMRAFFLLINEKL